MTRPLALLLGGLLLGGLVGWAAASPAIAADGYTMKTTAHYAVDPAAGRIEVAVGVEFTNTTPDAAGRLSSFDRIQLPVQDGATDATAADSLGGLTVGIAERDGVTVATVAARSRVRFGKTARFTLRFVLADQAASGVHVRPEVVEFAAWGFGTESEVTVVLPPGMAVSSLGDPLTSESGDAGTTLRSGPIGDPTTWLARITATGPVTYTTVAHRVTLASATVDLQIRSWSTDPAWGDRVGSIAAAALPLLESAVGLPYPRVGPLTLIESVPEAGAPEGEATSNAALQIAFSSSDFTVIHQLAHLWANAQLLTEHWLQEGLASHLSARVGDELGVDAPYRPAEQAAALEADAFPLEEWGSSAVGARADAYGYAASWALFDQAAAAVGEGNLRLALARGTAGISAYAPVSADAPGSTPRPIDARRLLDQLSEVGGLDLGELFAARVFPPDLTSELHLRAVARLAYRSLLQQAGDWGAPLVIRAAMTDWAFPDALSELGQPRAWLDARDQFLTALGQAGLTAPQRLRDRYLSDGGGPAAEAELNAERAVLDALMAGADRVAAPRSIAEAVGLIGGDDGSGMLADARASFVGGDLRGASEGLAALDHRMDGASVDGALRIAAVAAGLLLLGTVLVAGRRHRRRTHYTAAQ